MEWPRSTIQIPSIEMSEHWPSDHFFRTSSIFLLVPEMVPAIELARELELQLEKDLVKTPEIEPATALLSTLGFFCNGRPPDLVKYRLAGGFGGAGFTGGGFGLDGEGSGAELEVAPSQPLSRFKEMTT
ncbi:hypothetical protein AAG906_029747 [Vitis piasezkii]